MELKNKIDFTIVIAAENCNPNGDPTCYNQPRRDFDGHGEMTNVCLKRKIRDRLQERGESIFFQSDSHISDGCLSLKQRAENCAELQKEISKKKDANVKLCEKIACEKWFDVRTFGSVFAFKGQSVSFGVRGPVSITHARTLEPVDIVTFQYTKSMNSHDESFDYDNARMGTRSFIQKGVYVACGSIFPQLAEKTGFSQEDAEVLKEAMKNLLDNDASDFRPSGSMTSFLFWWSHNSSIGAMPSARVFRTLHISPTPEWPFFTVSPEEIPGVVLEQY